MHNPIKKELLLFRRAARNEVLSKFSDPRTPIRCFITCMNKMFPMRYTDADPCKIIYVDPKKIQFRSPAVTHAFYGRVVDGDWDKGLEPFEDSIVYKSIKQRFVNNYEWKDTEYLTKFEDSNSGHEFTNQIKHIEKLYTSICENGYITQNELLKKNPMETRDKNNDAAHPLLNEIGIYIGREGEFIFRSRGSHRLAIAKVLDIKRVPVQVSVRHKDWQQKRYQIKNGQKHELADETITHEDMDDITQTYRGCL